jgi:hypothetical protein
MNRRHFAAVLLFAGAAATGVLAQVDERRFSKGGGGGPPVGVFQVLAIDTDGRTLQLKSAADGSVSSVKVPDGVYDLSKLNIGDRIQVNLSVPDAMNPGVRASAIWPIK